MRHLKNKIFLNSVKFLNNFITKTNHKLQLRERFCEIREIIRKQVKFFSQNVCILKYTMNLKCSPPICFFLILPTIAFYLLMYSIKLEMFPQFFNSNPICVILRLLSLYFSLSLPQLKSLNVYNSSL